LNALTSDINAGTLYRQRILIGNIRQKGDFDPVLLIFSPGINMSVKKLFGGKRKSKTSESEVRGDDMCISNPYNIQQTFHVGFDQVSGVFVGLPETWQSMLSSSDIS
jgi:hypothetical protein